MTVKHFALTLAITFFALLMSVQAQTARIATVNVTSDSERVHIAAQGDVYEMRLDVADERGEVVFQSGAITGNTLDWKMTDSAGERVSAGTYLVTVTFRTAAGKLRKRVEQVTVDEGEKASTPTPAALAATPPSVPVKTTGTVSAGKIPKFVSIGPSQATVTNSVITQTSAGNIGIGTATPAAKLHLWGTNSRLRLQSTLSNVWTVTEYQTNNHIWHTGVGGSAVPNDVKGKYYIYDATAGAFRMVIDTSGRIGIGTTDPFYGMLDVQGGTGTAVHGDSSSGRSIEGFSDSGTGVYASSTSGVGVHGESGSNYGVEGISNGNYGVYGYSFSSYAGYFNGDVLVHRYLDVIQYAAGGSATVCRNNTRLAVCSSSLRYKTDIAPFHRGLDLINRLRPISFTWKDGGSRDFGLGAEDVATVEPLLVTHNERGEVEGVKYERVSVVLINAIKEQQAQIQQQREQIERLQSQVVQLQRTVKQRVRRKR